MNQYKISGIQPLEKKDRSNLLVPSVSSFRPYVNWQLVGLVGHSAVNCFKQFVLRPTMGMGQNGFPDLCTLFGTHLE